MKRLVYGVIITLIVVLLSMKLFNICPPSGPWLMPPWCSIEEEQAPVDNNTNIENNNTVQEEGNKYISHYLSSEVPIYGRMAWYNTEDLPLSITILAWGKHIPSDNYNNFDWMHNEQSKGAKHLSTISIWNNDEWVEVNQLPDDIKDSYVVDIYGNPIKVQGSLLLNILDPQMQNRLKKEIDAHIKAGTDGFVFDEIMGTAIAVTPNNGGGPFDNYSVSMFSNYLVDKGEESEGFNYKEYILENNLYDQYKEGLWSNPIPHQREYYYFLWNQTNNEIKDLIEYIKNKDSSLTIGANIDPLDIRDVSSFARSIDLYTYEQQWFPDWLPNSLKVGLPSTPSIKYGTYLGKDVAVMPIIDDFRDSTDKEREDAMKHQFAEVYASRGYYMFFPDLNYIGIEYYTNHSCLYNYYNFVRDHPELFLNLSTNNTIAIVVPELYYVNYDDDIKAPYAYSIALMTNNIQHDIVNVKDISKYNTIIINGFCWSDEDYNRVVEFVENGGRVVLSDPRVMSRDGECTEVSGRLLSSLSAGEHKIGKGKVVVLKDYLWWDIWRNQEKEDVEQLIDALGQDNAIETPNNVVALQYQTNDGTIIHLLNYNNNLHPIDEFNITVDISDIKDAILLSPEINNTIELSTYEENGKTTITIPSLDMWDIIYITRD